MNSYLNPIHEDKIAQIANEEKFSQISVSHKVSPLIKLVGRGDTTVVDAYLSVGSNSFLQIPMWPLCKGLKVPKNKPTFIPLENFLLFHKSSRMLYQTHHSSRQHRRILFV